MCRYREPVEMQCCFASVFRTNYKAKSGRKVYFKDRVGKLSNHKNAGKHGLKHRSSVSMS